MTTAAQRLAWLCDELAAGNAFSPDQLRKWADEARAEHAAAPDMLAALKGLMFGIDEGLLGAVAPYSRSDVAAVLKAAAAAITKAEGRS